MSNVEAKLVELKSAKATHVSLVKRAASRIPFRIVKSDIYHQENQMIDLGQLGKIFKGANAKKTAAATPIGPEIQAVVLSVTDDAAVAKVVEVLKGLDLPLTKATKSEDGEAVTLSLESGVDEGASVVKLSDELALVIKGFSPYSESFTKESTFGELASARGFYSNVHSATSVLTEMVSSALYESTTKSDAVEKVRKAVGDFGSYLEAMANTLPEKAFKAEASVSSILKSAKDDAEKAKMEAEEKAKQEEADKEAKAKKSEADGGGVGQPAPAAPADTTVTKTEPDFAALLAAALSPVQKSVEALAGEVKAIKTSTEQKIDEIARKADSAVTAVKTTVVAAAGVGDNPAHEATKKSDDSDPRTGAFDSAMLRR